MCVSLLSSREVLAKRHRGISGCLMNFFIAPSKGFRPGMVQPGVLIVKVSSASAEVRRWWAREDVGVSSFKKRIVEVLLIVSMRKQPPHMVASRNRYLNRTGNERALLVLLAN